MSTQFSGGTIVNQTFNAPYKFSIMQSIKNALCSNSPNAGWTNVSQNVQFNSVGTAPGGYGNGYGNSSVITITIASPAVITWNGHGFTGGEKIMFQISTGGTLPEESRPTRCIT